MGNSRQCVRKLATWFCIGLAALSSYAQSGRDVAQRAFPTVVLLMMEDSKGQPVSLGSGFFVRPGIIATNLHVIQGAARGYAKPIELNTKYVIEGTVGIDSRHDLALISVTEKNSPILTLENDAETAVGDEVYAVGNPRGLEGTLSKGIVSAIRKVDEETILQITAPISPGSSGGPVLNLRGNVIGIAAATLTSGQNLNFAIPSTYLMKLISSMTLPQPLSGQTSASIRNSVLKEIGGPSNEAIAVTNPGWVVNYNGSRNLEFRLKNNLDMAVRNIRLRFAFYDSEGEMISFVEHEFEEGQVGSPGTPTDLPAGHTVLRYCIDINHRIPELTRRVETQVLDFEIVQSGNPVNGSASDEASSRKAKELWDRFQYYFRDGQGLSAGVTLEELKRLRPRDPEVWFYSGEYERRMGYYEHAVTAYSDALRLKPDYAAAYCGRSVAYELLNRYVEAITDFTEGIRLRADYADAYRHRGDARKRSGDKSGAKVDYDKAKSLRR